MPRLGRCEIVTGKPARRAQEITIMTNPDNPVGTLPNGLPPPPVPQGLREMLKDYPQHIERLQEVLNTVVEKPSKVTPPFEVAIWVLESRLGTFISEAHKELETAEASSDPEAIVRADEKLKLMRRARSGGGGMLNISDLSAYFKENKGQLE